jgi:hypothetical protein
VILCKLQVFTNWSQEMSLALLSLFWVIIITCGGLQESKLYGAHFKEIGVDSAKATKITFGDSDDE